jgi:DNA-binding response OmpR family regulator
MNGFVFYEKVQGNKQLQQIPFLFLTGLRDEKLVCTGKELGADDYLMKPISRDTLLSALHGRLKRFRQLREFPVYPATAFG